MNRKILMILLFSLLLIAAACGDDEDNSIENTPAPTATLVEMSAPGEVEVAIPDENIALEVTGAITMLIPHEDVSYSAERVSAENDYYVLTITADDSNSDDQFIIRLSLRADLNEDPEQFYAVVPCEDGVLPEVDNICLNYVGTAEEVYPEIVRGSMSVTSLNPLSGRLRLENSQSDYPQEEMMDDQLPEEENTLYISIIFEDVPISGR